MASGREYDIMSSILDSNQLSGKHCACPACGGTDRFRFDRKTNRYHCGGGGDYQSGDWLSLVFHIEGSSVNAFNRAKALLGVEDDKIDYDLINEAKRLADEQRAERARLKTLRMQYDKRLKDNLYDLEAMIARRNYESSPDKNEIEQAGYLLGLIKDRYKI